MTYAEARDIARRVAQAMLNHGLNVEHPIAILSGNSVEHALIGLGTMIAASPTRPSRSPIRWSPRTSASSRRSSTS